WTANDRGAFNRVYLALTRRGNPIRSRRAEAAHDRHQFSFLVNRKSQRVAMSTSVVSLFWNRPDGSSDSSRLVSALLNVSSLSPSCVGEAYEVLNCKPTISSTVTVRKVSKVRSSTFENGDRASTTSCRSLG